MVRGNSLADGWQSGQRLRQPGSKFQIIPATDLDRDFLAIPAAAARRTKPGYHSVIKGFLNEIGLAVRELAD
ncbi:hypothetical protein HY57_21005 [Dyella japonica A8]|uniref:Uncharacterized protein n=1 Tax=Dyella japonica A8 TaxID=1217721 RepID=A0A075K5Q3_9GAMM|nr:hypothetical protein HY57_21005 [Dyella japonica A8]